MERNDHSPVAIQFLPIKLPNRGIDEKTKLDVLVRLVVVEVVRLVAAIVITKLQLKLLENSRRHRRHLDGVWWLWWRCIVQNSRGHLIELQSFFFFFSKSRSIYFI